MSWQTIAKEFGFGVSPGATMDILTPEIRMAEEILRLREELEHYQDKDVYKERDRWMEEAVAARRERDELRGVLQTIVDEYNKPPYSELDWVAWKQQAEKALSSAPEPKEKE